MARKTKETPSDMEIRWRKGSRFLQSSVPAESAYKEICKIKDANDGKISADQIVEFAQERPRSAMHKLIEDWDDSVAARKWRVVKAGNILRSIEVKYSEAQKEPVRAFNVDTSGWSKKESAYKPYRATEDIMQDEAARASLLQSALNELIAFQRRYRALQELSILMREIDKFMDDFHTSVEVK